MDDISRRLLIKGSLAAGASFNILQHGILGAKSPNSKLNIALIGAWGRGKAHWKTIGKENVVAICDVNEQNLGKAAKEFPKAKKYFDWRKAIEQKDIDAVVIATPDHHHSHITIWALNRNMHVYCEKPVAITVEAARLVRKKYLEKRKKVATQQGTQRHAGSNFARIRELVQDGAIGDLKSVYAWGSRQLPKPGYLPEEGKPPKYLHYDLWIGPSPFHPYNTGYFERPRPGNNCLSWNMYWDFGVGQIGDMGSHTMDLAWNPLDADLPTSAEAKGEKYNPDVTPVEMKSSFQIPANDWRGEIGLSWYQGGVMPKSPSKWIDLKKIGHGAMFKGSNGYIIADFKNRLIMPYGKKANMTYYKPRKKDNLIPELGHFQEQWINACKGDKKTACNFDYSGKMIETLVLGLVAYRVGKKIKYNGKTGKSDNSKANELMGRKYRKGWPLDG